MTGQKFQIIFGVNTPKMIWNFVCLGERNGMYLYIERLGNFQLGSS